MKADAFAALLTSVRQAGTVRRGESESSRVTAPCPTEATLRVTQRRVRELVRGRIELFSIDTLIGTLCCLDVSVSAKVGRRPGRIVRTAAASRAAFMRVMGKVRDGPPIPGDELDVTRPLACSLSGFPVRRLHRSDQR
jgi:hypothetical protein